MLPDAKREYLPISCPVISEQFERPGFRAVRAEGDRKNFEPIVTDVFHRAVLWPTE
jgi:hypothetical protein